MKSWIKVFFKYFWKYYHIITIAKVFILIWKKNIWLLVCFKTLNIISYSIPHSQFVASSNWLTLYELVRSMMPEIWGHRFINAMWFFTRGNVHKLFIENFEKRLKFLKFIVGRWVSITSAKNILHNEAEAISWYCFTNENIINIFSVVPVHRLSWVGGIATKK